MPTPGAIANRRLLIYLIVAAGMLSFFFVLVRKPQDSYTNYVNTPIHHVDVDKMTLQGDVIMPKLGNETLKAELGRASWKLLHTMMARYPDKPTQDEQTALLSYVHLFARLYPCGECAGHFRQILAKNPPQVRSRSSAAVWACHVHNEVNKSLHKDIFDCSKIGDFYDCGCADSDDESGKDSKTESSSGELKLQKERWVSRDQRPVRSFWSSITRTVRL